MEDFIYDEDQDYLDNDGESSTATREKPMGNSEAERMFAKAVGDLWLRKIKN